jgi:hypothetical protein
MGQPTHDLDSSRPIECEPHGLMYNVWKTPNDVDNPVSSLSPPAPLLFTTMHAGNPSTQSTSSEQK